MSDLLDQPSPGHPERKNENPLAPVSRLAGRMSQEAKKLGLKMVQFAVVPNKSPTGPHHCQAVFVKDEDIPEPTTVEVPPEIEKMLQPSPEEMDRRAAAEREQLKQLEEELRDPKKGIGLEDM